MIDRLQRARLRGAMEALQSIPATTALDRQAQEFIIPTMIHLIDTADELERQLERNAPVRLD